MFGRLSLSTLFLLKNDSKLGLNQAVYLVVGVNQDASRKFLAYGQSK